MGLGLSLCREIMHASGGTLSLESAGLGCGTTVALGLPIATNDDRVLSAHLAKDDDADTAGH
jgi:signal transduction histidine kinase